MGRDRALADGRLPVGIESGHLEFARDQIGHAIEDVVLVDHVLVQRHRLDAERLAEPAHRDRSEAALVRHTDGGLQDPFPTERPAALRGSTRRLEWLLHPVLIHAT